MSGLVKRQRKPAIGYTRTSSAANVGKDSVVRQRKAIQAFANRAGYRIIQWFDDPAVPGADTIDTRPGFMAALEMIAGNGVRTIIVETANRFARDLIVQEKGWNNPDCRRRAGTVYRRHTDRCVDPANPRCRRSI
jgi:DNA invertase Pin-like site-specific DNA recombinase